MPRIILFVLLSLWLSLAIAQSRDNSGKNELSLHGGFDLQGPNGDNIDFQLGYSWFLRNDLLLGGEYQWALMEDIAPGENDYRSQQANLVIEKLFTNDDMLSPYIGAEIGFRNSKFNDLDESGLIYGVRVGLRISLSDSVSLDGSFRYLLSDKEVYIVDFEGEDQYFYPSLGINAIF